MTSTYVPKPPPPDEINNSDLSGKKTLINGLLMLLSILAFLFFISKFVPEALVKLTPESAEIKIGKTLSKHPLLKDGLKSEKLDKILAKLLTSDQKVKINGISQSRARVENAFASVDKRIVVTSPLIKNSKSEIALAFVVAHEIGHIKHRHPLKSFYQNFLLRSIVSLLGSNDSMLNLSGDLASTAFSRKQETEADLYGLRLLYNSYGSIQGATDFFNRMKKNDKMISLISGSILSTHPLSKKRISNLKEYAKKMNWPLNDEEI